METEKRAYPPEVACTLDDLMQLEYQTHGFSYLPQQPVNSLLAGKHSSRLRGRGLDFEEVRLYAKGDDIRNIDWRVTARTGKTHSKVFTEERERPVFVVVDQTSGMFFGSKRFTKSVIAAQAAALAGFRVIRQGDRLGGMVFFDQGAEYVSPKRDRRSLMHFLKLIVQYNQLLPEYPEAGEFIDRVKTGVSKIRKIATHDFLIILISDFRRHHPEVAKSLVEMSRHNDILLLHVMDPLEGELPNQTMILENDRGQLRIDPEPELYQRYREDYKSVNQQFARKMRRYGIPVGTLTTEFPAAPQLRTLLGGGPPRKR
ncbi:DUF58 domain-containing protein [Pontibacter sp. G13]|uniref:DUF58 domain-containing protein n=1 Tax=Pontibacter sp. G13 TaxID=3074898 RepID=UPI00288AECC4|nr:DUF58 domain-containing protein [Pontibacter sp. G13]WNJ17360.1 DUF58 domain-containing protein [Pontibacter sp. G13]